LALLVQEKENSMATIKQIEADRLNARKSTGPKTPPEKQPSSSTASVTAFAPAPSSYPVKMPNSPQGDPVRRHCPQDRRTIPAREAEAVQGVVGT